MRQCEFSYLKKPLSQCDKILRCLEEHSPSWVPMPMLADVSGAYAVHSRISDLRRMGHVIEQESSRAVDGTVLSRYRLEKL